MLKGYACYAIARRADWSRMTITIDMNQKKVSKTAVRFPDSQELTSVRCFR